MKFMPPDLVKMIDEVKENLQILERCPGPHNFQPDPDTRVGDSTIYRRMRCIACSGWVITEQGRWYMRGVKHGIEHAKRLLARVPSEETKG